MSELKISVGGLNSLTRAFKQIDAEAPKQLRLALNKGADILVQHTRPEIPSVSGAARRSLVARSTRTSARVSMGGKKAAYTPWLDFGGEGRVKGRPAARPFVREGRYVYPTLRRVRPLIEAEIVDAVGQVVADVGLRLS